MDNPLTKFGSDVYQPGQPINLCYDTFAHAAALVRGLFEYLYRADGLTLIAHIPPAPCTAADQQYLDTAPSPLRRLGYGGEVIRRL